MGDEPPVADLYDAIPKVELHCHVEGSVRPQTVVELARKAGRTLAVEDPRDLYRYTSLDSFLAIFWMVQETLVETADWERIAYESLVDAAAHGLRYREMFFTPGRHLAVGQSLAGIIDGLTAGIGAAEADTRVHCRLVADMDRAYGPAAGRELVEQLAALQRQNRAERVIGVGMDSTELGVDLASFAEPFELAQRHGFRCTGHAGEAAGVGPRNILIGFDVLGLERIDHGIAVMEDPELTRRMAAERIP
jgi:adenine deaminase